MQEISRILLLTLMAGLAMPLGAALSAIDNIRPDWVENEFRHIVIAFGGGALLAAVSLVLVPEGAANLSLAAVAFWFAAGGLSFMALDIVLSRRDTPLSQLLAMLSDFIPEALALGASLAAGSGTAVLLAFLIALQNIPEGFNSSRELKDVTHYKDGRIVGVFVLLALLGPVCGLAGFYWLAGGSDLVSSIMLFAAGGILYITFGDIAPQAKLDNHWMPPLGAVAGFLLGVVGDTLI